MSTPMYDVIGSVDNRIQYFGRGLTLDKAQALKTELETNGIGGARTANGGFQGAIQNAQSVSNLTVAPSSTDGLATLTTVGENFSVTSASSGSDGLWYFTPAQTVESLQTVVPSVTGDYRYQLMQDGKVGLYMTTLTTSDTVSAVYTYYSDTAPASASETLAEDSDLDGATYIFETTYRYIPGSLTCTAEISGMRFVEGGANLIEIWYLDGNTRTAFPSGNGDITVTYNYNPGDQETVASAETHRDADELSRRAITPGTPQTVPPPLE